MRDRLLAIYRAGLSAADPERILARDLAGDRDSGWTIRGEPLLPPRRGDDPVFLFGAGKAAAALGRGVARELRGETCSGRLIVKYGHEAPVPGVEVEAAGHPLPDANSVAATRRLLEDLRRVGPGARVLLLVTGGASALLAAPAAGLTLEDKIATGALLLECGADIHEMNTVRRRLSLVKGGRLLPLLPPGRSAALLISDVVGDRLASIGSGPAVPDPTTFADALAVLRRYRLLDRAPPAVLRLLERGGEAEPSSPAKVPHTILASNRQSLDAAGAAARRLGYRVEIFARDMVGGVHETAAAFAGRLRRLAASARPVALLAGGELTLAVAGSGRGGRSQEFALVAAREMAGADGAALLAAGTDGTDGPTDAAGGFADGSSWERAESMRLDPAGALRRNDSYPLLDATGDLLRTGPTGTNVMDLVIGLAGSPESRTPSAGARAWRASGARWTTRSGARRASA